MTSSELNIQQQSAAVFAPKQTTPMEPPHRYSNTKIDTMLPQLLPKNTLGESPSEVTGPNVGLPGQFVSENSNQIATQIVQVLGNQRTKGSLIGQEGIVLRSSALGGWHWLKMSNGAEVKIQRNALLVIKLPPPEAQEQHVATPKHYPQVPRSSSTATPLTSRQHASSSFHQQQHPQWNIPAISIEELKSSTTVNFDKLDTNTLRRYNTHYFSDVQRDATREQLLATAIAHFASKQHGENTCMEDDILRRIMDHYKW